MGGILSCCFYCSSCDYALKNAERGDDFSLKGESVCAKVVSVYDGDTLRVVIRRRGELVQYNVRLLGCNAPEIRPRNGSQAGKKSEKAAAVAAKEELSRLVMGERKLVRIECGDWDKYGRLLATIFIDSTCGDSINVNEHLIEGGFAKPYMTA